MNKTLSIMLVMLPFLSSCGLEDKKRQLEMKEQSLQQRENNLLLREKELLLLADSLNRSIALGDSVRSVSGNLSFSVPDSLKGAWNVTMNCTQTTCNGFVVGDVIKETWLLSGGDSAYVQAMRGDKQVRKYTGVFNGAGFVLSAPVVDKGQSSTLMQVTLNVEHINKFSGSRMIQQSDGCTTTFTLDADRAKK